MRRAGKSRQACGHDGRGHRRARLLAAVFGSSTVRPGLGYAAAGMTESTRAAEPVGDQPDHAGVGAQRVADDIGTGVTEPILEEPIGEQVGRHGDASIRAAAQSLDRSGDGGRTGGGVREFYAIAGQRR